MEQYGYSSIALTQYSLDILHFASQNFAIGIALHVGPWFILKRDQDKHWNPLWTWSGFEFKQMVKLWLTAMQKQSRYTAPAEQNCKSGLPSLFNKGSYTHGK